MDLLFLIVGIVGALMTVGIVALVIMLYKRRKDPKQQKTVGADTGKGLAVSAAKKFARTHGFKLIAPAELAWAGRFANLDAIVIGYFGVLGIKAYGYNGEIYGEKGDEKWLQLGGDGARNYFDNPVAQAAADVRVIRGALAGEKLKTVPVEVVCVFTNKKAQLALPRSVPYYTLKTLDAQLRKDKYQADIGYELDDAEKAIRAAMVEK